MDTEKGRSNFIRRLLGRTSAVIGLVTVLIFAVAAIFAPWIAPHHYSYQDREARPLEPSSSKYLLGTDDLARDLLSRLIWGARVSFLVGLIAVSVGCAIGVTLGSIAGYAGGTVDRLIMALVDVAWSFPTLLLAIGLTAIMEPGLISCMLALGLVTWPQYARVVRGEFLVKKQTDFVESARSLGASDLRIIVRHILPHTIPPLIVIATLGMGSAILVEAALSYLGLGVQPPLPSWGLIISRGRNYLYAKPLMSFSAGACIMLLVLGFNLLGDGLRDAIDPFTQDS
ncbi:MAG: ABC transporter permease [Bacillota bacterium]